MVDGIPVNGGIALQQQMAQQGQDKYQIQGATNFNKLPTSVK
jgi:hypothetical protein